MPKIRADRPDRYARETSVAPYADFVAPFTPQGRPYVAINMVASLDGRIAVSGKSGSIGSETDRMAMRNLRAAADAVIVGAGSLRAEKMSLGVPEDMEHLRTSLEKSRQPLAVIIGGTSGLPLKENLIGFSPGNTLIFLPENSEMGLLRHAKYLGSVETLPELSAGGGLDLRLAFEILRNDRSVDFALVEGGPCLNRELFAQGLVNELFLTLAPKFLVGAPRTIIEGEALIPAPKPNLVSVHQAADELFLRYRIPAHGKGE